jgi:hypothetical protein
MRLRPDSLPAALAIACMATYAHSSPSTASTPNSVSELRAPVSHSAPRAPTRRALFQTIGSPFGYKGQTTDLATYLVIVPLETMCSAVRVGFGNPFSVDVSIASASAWPSSSYSDADLPQATGDPGGSNLQVVPTGNGVEAKLYFSFRGRDDARINDGRFGSTRSIVIHGNPTNRANVPAPFRIIWSDRTPITLLPRSDGGKQPLLFVYVTLAQGSGFTSNYFDWGRYNNNSAANQGRLYWWGQAWNRGHDYSDTPTATGFKNYPQNPVFLLECDSRTPGYEILISGDSLSASPTNDAFSSPIYRAAMARSRPTRPYAVTSFAWSSTPSSVYLRLLSTNLSTIKPSVLLGQAISRNDGSSQAALEHLSSVQRTLYNLVQSRTGARLIWNIAGGEPSWDNLPVGISRFAAIRDGLLKSGAPIIDAPSVTAPAGRPWDYEPGCSDDNTHLNYNGVERIVPLAARALDSVE